MKNSETVHFADWLVSGVLRYDDLQVQIKSRGFEMLLIDSVMFTCHTILNTQLDEMPHRLVSNMNGNFVLRQWKGKRRAFAQTL
jgi:hypothetical protein